MNEETAETKDDSCILFPNVPHKVLSYVKLNANKNDVASILSAIEKYSCECEKTIAIGPEKRAILERLVKECDPKTVVEFGTFFGYSALALANCLAPESVVFTIEVCSEFAKVSQELIEFAGMQRRIRILSGDSQDIIGKFAHGDYDVSIFDFVLLDHWKLAYKRDLIKLEEMKLIRKGSVIVADNVVFPGCPGYLEYVRNNSKYESSIFPAKDAYSGFDDAMEKSVYLGK